MFSAIHMVSAPMTDFDRALAAIAGGKNVNPEDLLPFLCEEDIRARLSANYRLAEAYSLAGKSEQAKVFIQRAWEFSGFIEECLPLYIRIHAAVKDVASIREAYKRLGMKKAAENQIGAALQCFNSWHYADAVHRGVDSYRYDYDILACISNIARPFSFPPRRAAPRANSKIRLAYLTFGMMQVNSVIVKHSLSFAEFHDKNVFEVHFFVPEQESLISRCDEARGNIKKLRQSACTVTIAKNSKKVEESLTQLAAAIYEFQPDLLITSAGLADLKHYFIAALRPAPLVVGLCQGPPPQYSAPAFDWSISWTKHPLMDCPTSCSLVTGGVVLPTRNISAVEAKSLIPIPAGSLVLLSCGRPTKFQDLTLLNSILEVLRQHPHVYYVMVGISEGDLPDGAIAADVRGQVIILGWQQDFMRTISMADVVIDTYPSGGGVTLLDAMALGIPVVSFHNNYMQHFTQTDWNPAEEFVGIPELLVERGNMEHFRRVLARLITDNSYRTHLSRTCVEAVSSSGNPEHMVRSCEEIYVRLVREQGTLKGSEADFKSLLPPLCHPRSLSCRIVDTLKRTYKGIGKSAGRPS